MYFYPECPNPKCRETNLEICDSQLNGIPFKTVVCPHCQIVVCMYLDNSSELKELQEKIDDLESRISDLEDLLP